SKVSAYVRTATNLTDAPTPPSAGHLHLDALWWTAGAETSDREIDRRACCVRSSRLPSLPQASRSYDRLPHGLNSLTPDAHRAGPLHPRRLLSCDLLSLVPLPQGPDDALSCDNCCRLS